MTRVSDRSPPALRRVALTFLVALAAFVAGAAFTAQARKAPSTQVIADEQNHIVRIVVDGKDIVTVDASGLHVTGDVTYSGVFSDTGASP